MPKQHRPTAAELRARIKKVVAVTPLPPKPPKPPITTGSQEFDDTYNFCDDDERQRLVDRMEDDLQAIQQRSLDLKEAAQTTNVRFTFTFTNYAGVETVKMFTSFDSLAAFLLLDKTRSASVGINQPDWSPEGLCQFGKELIMGVAGFRIDSQGIKTFIGFKANYPIYHYYGA